MRELAAAKPQTEGETNTGKVNGGYDTFLSDQKSVAKESLKEGFRFPSLRIIDMGPNRSPAKRVRLGEEEQRSE